MLRGLLKLLNAEIVFGFLIATVFWIGILGWQAAYAPSEIEKRQCEESARQSGHKAEECKTLWERTTTDPVAFFTFWLVVSTVGLGISTSLLWVAGEKQFGFLTRNATAQSIDTKNSIAEASRAATAMESVATGIAASAKAAQESVATLRERTAAQMRPYLTVLIGTGVYQERGKNLKFEVKPLLVNSGHTPAHNVTYRAKAAVLDSPLPEDVVLNDPDHTLKSSFVLGPQQNITLNAIVDECSPSAPLRQTEGLHEGRISGSS